MRAAAAAISRHMYIRSIILHCLRAFVGDLCDLASADLYSIIYVHASGMLLALPLTLTYVYSMLIGRVNKLTHVYKHCSPARYIWYIYTCLQLININQLSYID